MPTARQRTAITISSATGANATVGGIEDTGTGGLSIVSGGLAITPSNLLSQATPASDSIGHRRYAKHLLVRTVDGVSLAVCDTGPRSAEHTVVFLHGLCLDRTSWDCQITHLRRRYGRSVRSISYSISVSTFSLLRRYDRIYPKVMVG